MKTKTLKKFLRSGPLGAAIVPVLILFAALNHPRPIAIEGDGVFYHAWFQSVFFDRDIDFANQLRARAEYDFYSAKFTEENISTQTGLTPNPYAFGAAIFWAPFLSAVHTVVSLGDFSTADGYSSPYTLALNFATLFYGLAALATVRSIAGMFFPPASARLATVGLWLATPWFYYQLFEPSMSHIPSLLAVSLFWFLALRLWRGERVNLFFWATVIFLLVSVRWQNALFLLAAMPLFFGRGRFVRKYLFSAAAAAAAAAALQMVAWKTLYGAFLLIPQGGSFLGAEFHGLATVFSTDRGILLWAPIMIVSLFGLWPLAARKSIRPVFTAVVLAVVFQWLINSALSDPGGGDAFGPRRFVELAPFLVLPLAALAARFPRTVLIAVVLTTVCTGFLLAAFRDGFLPRSGEFDWPAAWERFFSR